MNQEISSLMDGELDSPASERAIRDCCASQEGKQSWETYHLIGESIRGNAHRRFDISAAVMRAIEKEPTVLAPGAIKPRPRPMQAFGRVALAAAASVATIGVVGWIGFQGMPGASTAPAVAQNASGVTMQANVPVDLAKHQPEPTYAAIEVNDYLAAHRQVPSPDQYRTVATRASAPAR